MELRQYCEPIFVVVMIALSAAMSCAPPDIEQSQFALVEPGPWDRHVITPYNPEGGAAADGQFLIDVDDDGRVDVVTAWESGRGLSWSQAPGFAPSTTTPRWGEYPWATRLIANTLAYEGSAGADIDGDGHVDIVGAPVSQGTIVPIFFGDGGDSWVQVNITLPNSARLLDVVVADTEGDGDLDIFAFGQRSRIFHLVNPGTASARTAGSWTATAIITAKHVMRLSTFDAGSGDGLLDIVFSSRYDVSGRDAGAWYSLQGPAGVWNTPGEVDRESDGSDFPDGPTVSNGRPMGHCITGEAFYQVYRNPGEIWRFPLPFSSGIVTRAAETVPDLDGDDDLRHCAFGDPDGDGDPDMLLTSVAGPHVLIAPASGLFPHSYGLWDQIDDGGLTKLDRGVFGDADDDGDVDVIVTDETDNGSGPGQIWFENPRL